METNPSTVGALGVLRSVLRRARTQLRGGTPERTLRSLMRHVPPGVQRGLVHLLPQPTDFDPRDARDVTLGGVRFELYPREYIQWVHYFGWPDPNFESLSCLAQNSRSLIDIGANVGIYSLRVAARAPACRVTAVEAHPRTFARLLANVQRNPLLRIEVLSSAIASTTGVLTLYDFETGDSGFTSAVQRDGMSSTRVEVPAMTLDGLVAQRGLEPDLLKIDVEGFEADVLAGGSNTLSERRPDIVLEWTPEWTRGRSRVVGLAVDILERCNYRCWQVPSFEQDRAKEVPVAALRADSGGQRNLVLSVKAATPARLEGWFHEALP